MRKFNVLIPDGNDRRTIKVVQSLGISKQTNVFVVTEKNNIVKYSRFAKPFFVTKNATDDEINVCIEEILKKKVDVILSIGEMGANYIHRNKWLKEYKIAPFPEKDTIKNVSDKWELNRICIALELECPKSIVISKKEDIGKISCIVNFPVLIKPVIGQGGEGIVLVKTKKHASEFFANPLIFSRQKKFLIQEYISGADIDISILCHKGSILAYTIQEPIDKAEEIFKFSKKIKFLMDKKVLAYCEKLVSEIQYSGVAHLDFKKENNSQRLFLIDFNARFWGTLLGSTRAGVNFPYLSCLSGLGIKFPGPEFKNISYVELDRDDIFLFMVNKKERKNVALRNSRLYYSLLDPWPFILKKPSFLGKRFHVWG